MSQLVFEKTETQTFPAELTVIHCGCCGGIYAINEKYRKKKYETNGHWNCPYCQKAWGYFGESAIDKEQRLRKQAEDTLARERARFDQQREGYKEVIATKEAQRRAEKGAKTRLKKRAASGICPCCNRYFVEVHKHMLSQHPEFVDEADAESKELTAK